MAIPCLRIDSEARTISQLRNWLAGDWALLFSHPGDFQYQGLIQNYWLDDLHDEFQVRGVRPLVLCREGAPEFPNGDGIQLDGSSLPDELQSLESPYVLIIDDELQIRGTVQYDSDCCDVSIFDLLACIDALRRNHQSRQAA